MRGDVMATLGIYSICELLGVLEIRASLGRYVRDLRISEMALFFSPHPFVVQ